MKTSVIRVSSAGRNRRCTVVSDFRDSIAVPDNCEIYILALLNSLSLLSYNYKDYNDTSIDIN